MDSTWIRRHTIKSLGHYIDDDAGIQSCFSHCRAAMWRCFFGSRSAGLQAAGVKAKMRFLSSIVATIPSFRWARWPLQDTYRAKLDSIQRHMIGILMAWRPTPQEDFEAFRHRRHRLSSSLAAKHGKWGSNWLKKVKDWGDHVHRNHDSTSWSLPLLNFHDDTWLHQQRLLHSRMGESRTNTRACRAKVHRRWQEGYHAASG